MPYAVQHHLSYRPTAIRALARRLIIDGLGEAGGSSLPIVGGRLEHEAPRGRVGAVSERPFGIFLQRLFGRHRFQEIWRREIVHRRSSGGGVWYPCSYAGLIIAGLTGCAITQKNKSCGPESNCGESSRGAALPNRGRRRSLLALLTTLRNRPGTAAGSPRIRMMSRIRCLGGL